MKGFFDVVYNTVKLIPRGRVATYGQIAAHVGSPRGARAVGWALHVLNDSQLETIPWHRVVNREGRISTTCAEHTDQEQAYLLAREGVDVSHDKTGYHINLRVYLWDTTK